MKGSFFVLILDRQEVSADSFQCCCLLGKEIGFNETVVEGFKPLREVYTSAPLVRKKKSRLHGEENKIIKGKKKFI